MSNFLLKSQLIQVEIIKTNIDGQKYLLSVDQKGVMDEFLYKSTLRLQIHGSSILHSDAPVVITLLDPQLFRVSLSVRQELFFVFGQMESFGHVIELRCGEADFVRNISTARKVIDLPHSNESAEQL